MSFSSCDNSMDGSSFPPSPVEGPPHHSGSSPRLSWGNVLFQKLSDLNNKAVSRHSLEDSDQCSETGSMDLSMSESTYLCHPLEETLATEVVATIAQRLRDESHLNIMGCCTKLLLPDLLLQHIREELLHLADSEPCGLRGAHIDLCVEQGDNNVDPCHIEEIAVDASLVPTFHITLVLRPEAGLWHKVQKLFNKGKKSSPVQQPQTQSGSSVFSRHKNTLTLSPGFRAIKRKLYCSEELLIEECC